MTLLAASLATGPAHAANLKGEGFLVRPEPALDDDASGKVVVEVKPNDERFRVSAKHLDTSLAFDLFMEDAVGSGNFVLFSAMTLNGQDFVVDIRESDGPLPLSAASVDDYAGREMHIRNGSDLYLFGPVPEAVKIKGKKGFSKAEDVLDRPDPAPDGDATGEIQVWSKVKDGRQRIRVRADHLDANGSYTVHLEDAVGSGTFQEVADLEQGEDNGSDTSFRWSIDTKNGDPLPFGVSGVDDLAGRVVQIRDGADQVILTGVVPSIP